MIEVPITQSASAVEGRSLSTFSRDRRSTGVTQSIRPSDVTVRSSHLTLDEQLFDERAKLKIAVSGVSMHLEKTWRESVFNQIDVLFSAEDWEHDSSMSNGSAFRSLLRFVVFARPLALPGLAIAPNGNPVGSWVEDGRRVHVEFQPGDLANAVLVKPTERGIEAVSWRGPIANLGDFVRGFGNGDCLGW